MSIGIAAACGVAVSERLGCRPGVRRPLSGNRVATGLERAPTVSLPPITLGAAWSMVPICRNYFRIGNWLRSRDFLGHRERASGPALAVGLAMLGRGRALAYADRHAPIRLSSSGIIGWATSTSYQPVFSCRERAGGAACDAVLAGPARHWPRRSAVAALVVAWCSRTSITDCRRAPPPGWQSVNTDYGDIATSLTAQYSASLRLRDDVRDATAAVMVFPEGTVPHWSSATARALRESLAHSNAQVVLLGAQVQAVFGAGDTPSMNDVYRALQILHEDTGEAMALSKPTGEAYRNVLVAITAESVQAFDQHIPVPIAMWRPFGRGGVPIHLWRNRPVDIVNIVSASLSVTRRYSAGRSAMVDSPNVLVLIANDHWSRNSSIPSFQLGAMWSWSRLFQTPFLRAANQ